MRKADYSALAAIVKEQRAIAEREMNSSLSNAELAKASERHAIASVIAHQFVARASVNRVEFLKACGIAL